MKLLLFATLLVGAYTAPYDTSIMTEWNDYKTEHGKHYDTVEEDHRRLQAYLATKKTVQAHNLRHQQGLTSYTMAINQFADWYPEELDKLGGLRVDKNRPKRDLFRLEPGKDVPDSINWVAKGAVTSVKCEGVCVSGYAFSAVGALEGLMFLTNKTIQSLSAQEIVDCTGKYSNSGCQSGSVDNALKYVIDRGGIDSDESYSYIGEQGQCRADKGKIVASCKEIVDVEFGNETALKEAVGTVGPVSIGFAVADSFAYYHKGIYEGPCFFTRINHAMLLVGYGTDEATGKDYWLIKNCWGTKWGDKGYIKGEREDVRETFAMKRYEGKPPTRKDELREIFIQPEVARKLKRRTADDYINPYVKGAPVDYSFRKVYSLMELENGTPREYRVGIPKKASSGKYISSSLWANYNHLTDLKHVTSLVNVSFNRPELVAWLDVSFNEIQVISNELLNLVNLKILYLHGNQIKFFIEVAKLKALKNLRTLTLHGNPIEENPNYRTTVVRHLPWLVNLDFSLVMKE